ncbi:MAG: TRAP transporter small permease [Rhodobacteraceae bacterium]|nr:TRAP transporter small permease [Paracoccaceae bacterium]
MARVASLFLACAVVLMAAQVFLRFGFNRPQAWAEEVDRYLFIWSVYLGALVALQRGSHIRVTFVIDAMGSAGATLSKWLTRICALGAFAFTAWHGYGLALVNLESEFYTIPGMPQILFYLAAPVGLTLMCLVLIADSVADLMDGG